MELVRIKSVIFDVDGVLIRGKTPTEGAVETVRKVRENYKTFVLSNNSSHSRSSYAKLLRGMGFDFSEKEIYVSSYGVAVYLKNRFKPTSVYTITGGGLAEEIEKMGFEIKEGKEGEKAEIVAVGFDTTLNYEKLSIAFRAIKNGAFFIASNQDRFYPVEDGELPGAGLTVRGLEFATGVKPVVIGKPERFVLDLLLKENGLKKDEVLVVGDSEETDIRMARRMRVRSVLIGKAKRYKPTYEIEKIEILTDVLHKLE
ncbi:MAG: HAD-IIA family hydrolase [Candidatus Anstonellales archaeon]